MLESFKDDFGKKNNLEFVLYLHILQEI